MNYTCPLEQILEYPAGMPATLKRFFNLSMMDFYMLHACNRDCFRNGLDPVNITKLKWDAVHSLKRRGFVEFNFHTEKWETNSTGRALLLAAQFCIQENPRELSRRLADVLMFPCKGNSA